MGEMDRYVWMDQSMDGWMDLYGWMGEKASYVGDWMDEYMGEMDR